MYKVQEKSKERINYDLDKKRDDPREPGKGLTGGCRGRGRGDVACQECGQGCEAESVCKSV